jgi:methyl-accepting chemotaxis protein
MGFRNYSIGSRLILGFGVVLLLVVLLGGIAFQQTNKLWKNTADMYEHPLQVSRATRDIKANIITIQWLMKDVVLDEKLTRNDVVAITHQIDDYEARVYKSFDIVYDRYLGDKKDIDQAFNSFRNWNPKRDILIDLKQKGDAKGMYDRFKTVNVPYMVTMLKNVQTLIDYANNKADTLYLSAQNDKDMLFTRLWIVMIAIFILTFVVGLLLIRGIRSPLIALTKVAEKFRKKHYEVRSDYVSTNEIGTLAATFNHLGARVEQEIMVKENAAWISGILLKENDLDLLARCCWVCC